MSSKAFPEEQWTRLSASSSFLALRMLHHRAPQLEHVVCTGERTDEKNKSCSPNGVKKFFGEDALTVILSFFAEFRCCMVLPRYAKRCCPT